MDKELQKYYENRFGMMVSQGWKDLIEDIDEMIKATSDISSIPDEKSLNFKKGELSILHWIKGLKEISEQAYEDLK